ncbi:MAG TPA: TlpA disulfide reductase family protein [Candidatus Binatia bacterium]|nr:TlpA disulfide reductase family protein [Candidatus Binatia bacterium]
MMQRWGVGAAIIAVGLIAATWFGAKPARHTGFPAPDFSAADLRGSVQRLSDYRGKIVFLNVWATWCPPCRMEMPSMEQLYRRFKDRDFVMLAVSQDTDGPAAVRALVEQVGVTFPVLIDPDGEVSRRYGVTGYPETFVIDRDGKVIEHFIGPEDWGSTRSYQYFAHLLQADSNPQQVRADPAVGS